MAIVVIIYVCYHRLPTYTVTAKAWSLPLPAQIAHELLVPLQSENMRTSASVAVQAWLCTLPSPVLYMKLPSFSPLLPLLKPAPPPACVYTVYSLLFQETSKFMSFCNVDCEHWDCKISKGLMAPFQATESWLPWLPWSSKFGVLLRISCSVLLEVRQPVLWHSPIHRLTYMHSNCTWCAY